MLYTNEAMSNNYQGFRSLIYYPFKLSRAQALCVFNKTHTLHKELSYAITGRMSNFNSFLFNNNTLSCAANEAISNIFVLF